MSTFVLDTLDYAEKLKAGGFTEQQAATQARALAEIIERQMAAEADARKNSLRRDIESLRSECEHGVEALSLDIKHNIAEAKAELIRWIVGIGLLQTILIIGMLMAVANRL